MGSTVRLHHREHGAAQHADRRELEREGWRTTLEYRENHVRGRDGRLRSLEVVWHAEAEREIDVGERGRRTIVISAMSSSLDRVWTRLRLEAEVNDVRMRRPASA